MMKTEKDLEALVGTEWTRSLTGSEMAEFLSHVNAVEDVPDYEIAPAFRGFVRGCEFYRGIITKRLKLTESDVYLKIPE